MSRIAVSIVAYHPPLEELGHCLDCLRREPEGTIDRVDVIDNGSKDDGGALEKWLKENYPEVNYRASENVGYGRGHNLSVRETLKDAEGAEYHLVTNCDISFYRGMLRRMADYMDAHPKVGLTTPKIFYPDGTPQASSHPLPSIPDLIGRRIIPRKLRVRGWLSYDPDLSGITEPINVPCVYGCFMLMRSDALRQTGIFDERFFLYLEDVDLSRRLHERWLTEVLPSERMVHIHHAASRKKLSQLWIHLGSMVKYYTKWGWVIDEKRRKSNREFKQQLAESEKKRM